MEDALTSMDVGWLVTNAGDVVTTALVPLFPLALFPLALFATTADVAYSDPL
jgi:hypothetical protein